MSPELRNGGYESRRPATAEASSTRVRSTTRRAVTPVFGSATTAARSLRGDPQQEDQNAHVESTETANSERSSSRQVQQPRQRPHSAYCRYAPGPNSYPRLHRVSLPSRFECFDPNVFPCPCTSFLHAHTYTHTHTHNITAILVIFCIVTYHFRCDCRCCNRLVFTIQARRNTSFPGVGIAGRTLSGASRRVLVSPATTAKRTRVAHTHTHT